jgi:HK97 family phage major capsid protein
MRKLKEKSRKRERTAFNSAHIAPVMLLLAFVPFALCGIFGYEPLPAICLYAAIPAFVIPAGIKESLQENEAKGLQAVGDYMTGLFKQYEESQITEKAMLEKMDESLKNWAEKEGISSEKLKTMSEALKAQGKELQALKERPLYGIHSGGLKKEFVEQYEKLKTSIQNHTPGFVIKANPDTSDNALLESRPNIITTTTGANLVEQEGHDPQLYLKRRDRQYIHDIADVSYVAEVPETMSFDEEGDESGTIAVVSENGLKPQVKLTLVRNKVEAKKAAGFIVVTEETMKWRTRVWASIQRLFRDKVYRNYEDLLTNDLLANTTQYIATPLDETIAAPTDYDAIAAAICQLEQLNFIPDTLVINPSSKWAMATTKDNTGRYLFPYINQGGNFKVVYLNTITTNKVAPGEFIVGESGIWKVEEEPPRLRTALVNDDAIHNRMTIIGEIFFLSYVPSNNAGGFIKANFNDVKEALLIPEAAVSE